MTTSPQFPTYRTEAALRAQSLTDAGFKKTGKGFRKGDTTLKPEKGWVVLESKLPKSAEQQGGKLGAPGLWKVHATKLPKQRFAFPENLTTHLNHPVTEESISQFSSCVAWAMQTRKESSLNDWVSPSEDEIQAWLGSRTLQIGDVIRQIELNHSEKRLSLQISILDAIPKDRKPHQLWLDRLISDAQEQWALARIEFRQVDEQTEQAIAEIDLTGAPDAILSTLFLTSVDTLRWIAASLVPTAEFLVSDSAQLSRALNDDHIKGQQS
ncbi:MAG: hypothetical protein AAGH89_19195 [Verrucomicrobiota bacterium]